MTSTPKPPCRMCGKPDNRITRGMCHACYQWWRYHYADNAPEIQAKEHARQALKRKGTHHE